MTHAKKKNNHNPREVPKVSEKEQILHLISANRQGEWFSKVWVGATGRSLGNKGVLNAQLTPNGIAYHTNGDFRRFRIGEGEGKLRGKRRVIARILSLVSATSANIKGAAPYRSVPPQN